MNKARFLHHFGTGLSFSDTFGAFANMPKREWLNLSPIYYTPAYEFFDNTIFTPRISKKASAGRRVFKKQCGHSYQSRAFRLARAVTHVQTVRKIPISDDFIIYTEISSEFRRWHLDVLRKHFCCTDDVC